MNSPVGTHEMTPEFRAHLQWQIESALRRQTRFVTPAGGGVPRAAAAMLMIVSLVAGGIGVAASQQLQEARQRSELLEMARAELALVGMRVELARADLEEARRRYEVGAAGRETLQTAELQVRAMEAALARTQLDIQEIEATGAAPRNELHAPRVGSRDFVRERLMLDMQAAQQALVAAEQAVVQATERVRVGLAPRAAQLQMEAELARAHGRMQQLRVALELRQRTLSGEMKLEELAAESRRMELMLHRDRLQREVEILRGRIVDLRRQLEAGLASQLDVKRAEVELLEREVEYRRMVQEYDKLASRRQE